MTFGRLLGCWMLVPATVFLTISYFVCVVNEKLECKGLKKLGTLVSVLLWICALLAVIIGVIIVTNGKTPIVNAIQAMMQETCKACTKSMPMGK